MQTNGYHYQIRIVTWNHIFMYKLLELDKNTWDDITVYKLFVFRIVTWSYNCL